MATREPLDRDRLADESFGAYEDAPTPETRLLGALTAATAAREGVTEAIKNLTIVVRLWTARIRIHAVPIEVTGFTKTGGPLTKRISLSEEGKLLSDASACVMSAGIAWRATFDGLLEFADLISDLESTEAIALGALPDEFPEAVQVVTKRR